jgi:tRNA(fMet)-specific endonuclease VapC
VPFLIDTNIAIHARDGHAPVLEKFAAHGGEIFLSAISLAELQRGLHGGDAKAELRRLRLEALLPALPVVSFDAAAARTYGGILALRGWTRSRDFDRLIAAQALSIGAVLVTNNEADFRDIPGLKLENWIVGP